MKKARIMLVAIATFGIVGGAVAFKANYGTHIYTGSAAGVACNATVLNATIAPTGALNAFATTTFGAACVHTRTVANQ